MKKYIAPQTKVLQLGMHHTILDGSWNSDDKFGVNPIPGGQSAFE